MFGFAVGFIAKKGPPRPYDFSDEVTVLRMNKPAESGVPTSLRPYAVCIDGVTKYVGNPPSESQDVWMVRLADGRVMVHAVKE